MNLENIKEKRFFELTGEEVCNLLSDVINKRESKMPEQPKPIEQQKTVRGLRGISKLLGIGKTNVCYLNTMGVFEPAIKIRSQRNAIYYADKVTACYNEFQRCKKNK